IVAAVIPGGHDHNNTGLPSCFYGLAQRIYFIALKNRPSKRQVDYSDVVLRFQSDGALNSRDNETVSAVAIAVDHLEVDQADVRRNSGKIAERCTAVSADDARDVGSMAIVVVRFATSHQILSVDNSARTIAWVTRVGVQIRSIGDAAVYDSDANPGAIETILLGDVGIHRLEFIVRRYIGPGCRLDRAVRRYISHVRIVGQVGERAAGDGIYSAIQEAERS